MITWTCDNCGSHVSEDSPDGEGPIGWLSVSVRIDGPLTADPAVDLFATAYGNACSVNCLGRTAAKASDKAIQRHKRSTEPETP